MTAINFAKQIKNYGNSLSLALLDATCDIFSVAHVEGIIGYRSPATCAVVFGDPISEEMHHPQLASSFHDHCKKLGKSVLYIGVSSSFAQFSIKNTCHSLIEIGEEPILNPQRNYLAGTKGKKLRAKVNHSRQAGTQVFEYQSYNKPLAEAMENVAKTWLASRKGFQLFLAKVDLFSFPEGKRFFYAKQGEEIVAFLQLNHLESKKGFALNCLMTTPQAIPGTSEHLIIHALQELKKEGCCYFTAGFIPANNLGEIVGFHPLFAWILKKAYLFCRKLFKLQGRKRYWKKFHPEAEKRYILFSEKKLKLSDISGLFKALNIKRL